ncbi:MAG: nicotinate-nucleotide adenylyltransferase [Sphingobacteriales bacterium]|jgi:nicotinate-nucleotide adenylyltransferase
MKKVGLYFGSFNPIHVGHLIISNYMVNHTNLDEVWFVVSPQNPLKKQGSLINVYDRIEMARLAIGEDNLKLRVSDVEVNLPIPSYTIDTLIYLKETQAEIDFSIIMGADNVLTIQKWKNFEVLLRDYQIYVYPRPGYGQKSIETTPNIHWVDAPLMEISSSFIRKSIKNNKSVKYIISDKVIEFIEKSNLYS